MFHYSFLTLSLYFPPSLFFPLFPSQHEHYQSPSLPPVTLTTSIIFIKHRWQTLGARRNNRALLTPLEEGERGNGRRGREKGKREAFYGTVIQERDEKTYKSVKEIRVLDRKKGEEKKGMKREEEKEAYPKKRKE